MKQLYFLLWWRVPWARWYLTSSNMNFGLYLGLISAIISATSTNPHQLNMWKDERFGCISTRRCGLCGYRALVAGIATSKLESSMYPQSTSVGGIGIIWKDQI